ncbi:SGNH hydrolase [Dactylosporangium vinaceum]|uniref:SGNH/GDSL hydrolase family protein n=1 Tax=Dactylosporangium vinaceum TaxID=53362 RepID=A0ABV5M214_9ACTN|nr:SGNH/GDSL hydrolase family protein [Dactylosporangium vinaceum]UAB99367.1 SGNH hydrolase [Dactylosporangium vinaceum]
MRRATTMLAAATLTALTLGTAACGDDPQPIPDPTIGITPLTGPVVRIMPLGDSITDGRTANADGAYRVALWKQLTAAGVRVDFVGSLQNGPEDLPDHDHEGHSGYRIDQDDAQVTQWVKASDPRIVLIHLGTNDALQDYDMPGAPARMSLLIDHVMAAAPEADIFVGSLLPLQDHGAQTRASLFSAALPGIVRDKGAKVHFVDMGAAHMTLKDIPDGIHPGTAGFTKMAKVWSDALKPMLTAAPKALNRAPKPQRRETPRSPEPVLRG